MMRRLLLPLLLILLLMASCSTTGSDEADDDGRSIVITLPENPSTGYSWIWGQMGPGHIEMTEEAFIPGSRDNIGTPGTHVYTFIGTKPGHVTLTFSSRQPWQGGGIGDTEAFSVTVYEDMTISYL